MAEKNTVHCLFQNIRAVHYSFSKLHRVSIKACEVQTFKVGSKVFNSFYVLSAKFTGSSQNLMTSYKSLWLHRNWEFWSKVFNSCYVLRANFEGVQQELLRLITARERQTLRAMSKVSDS